MTAYNVISPGSLQAGQPEDISVILANLQAIQGVLNGGVDDANINAAAALAISKLAGYPSDGQKLLKGDGTWATMPPIVTGDELAYAEKTTPTVITSRAAATPTTIVDAPSITCDGTTPVIVEGFIPQAKSSTVAGTNIFYPSLWDSVGPTELGEGGGHVDLAWLVGPLVVRRRVTPAAGAHVFSLKAYSTLQNVDAQGGVGGTGIFVPAYIRVSRVSPIPPSVAAGSFSAVYYGTTFPVSPADGQEAILVDSVTNPSYQWRFRYNAGSSSPYKWEFVGGPPWTQFVAADRKSVV